MTTFLHNNQRLTNDEANRVMSFMAYLIKQNPVNLKMIYRGINYSILRESLNLSGENEFERVSQFLFLIGDKGRLYRQEYQNKIRIKRKLHSITDSDDDIFKYIFNKYNKILNIKGNLTIEKFIKNNPIFSDYFLHKNHLRTFIETIKEFPKDLKIQLRDYYFLPLHQLGVKGIYPNSFFVSTTKRFNVAKKFAVNTLSKDSIILYSWISRPFNRYIQPHISIERQSKVGEILHKLPIYSRSFFPRQSEVSLKGGLLPHYLLGYLRLRTNEFEVNPYLFSTTKSFLKIIKEGFDIDQAMLLAALKETDYIDFFTVDENGNYFDTLGY